MSSNSKQILLTCDSTLVAEYLDNLPSREKSTENETNLLYFLGNVDVDLLNGTCDKRSIIHMIGFSLEDINLQDKDGDTALHIVLKRHNGDTELCEPLLQLGADMYIPDENGQRCCDLITQCPSETKKIFERYMPGLWHAVERDDLTSVRRLVNLWCTTEICHKGKSLKELTFEKGTEHIITLVTKVQPSMKLAHAVLAKDYVTAKKVCESNVPPKMDFKNLGDMGATPLFYAISQNNTEMVQLLCKHGARIDSLITLQDEEIPIIFTALNSETDLEIIKCLIAPVQQCQTLHTLHYRGLNVLMHCIQNDVSVVVVRHILQQGHSRLVAQRDQQNFCARDIANHLGRSDCVKALDEAIHEWYLGSDGSHRKTLALCGYTGLHLARKEEIRACDVVQSMETSSQQAQFDMQLQQYQNQIIELASAVINGYLDQVKQLIFYNSSDQSCFHRCLIDACPPGDGQSILHKAVLHNQRAVVQYLAETFVYQVHRKIDEIRDQWQRTALHYAYAHDDNDQIVNVLLDVGASEFTLDMDGISPHVLRDFRKRPEMRQFIKYHCIQDYSNNEPKPWKRPRPPIKLIMATSARHSHYKQHNSQLQSSSYSSHWTSYCAIL